MRVLITGATGLVGKELVKQCLDQKIQVHYLTTSKQKINSQNFYQGFYWNPIQNEIDVNCFEDVDVIINLAGASISKRWTNAYKEEVLQSRIQSLKLLKKGLQRSNHTIKQFISASAIGIYPDSLINYYEENQTDFATGFLGDVVKQWEDEADAFSTLGVKVAKIRIGLVLAKEGGALPKLAKPVSYGLGAPFGSGKQWQSWIHISDLAKFFLYVMHYNLDGIFNGVSPNPVSNKDLVKAIANQLKRPLFLPHIPKFVLKLILGEMHTLLFDSQRVSSKKIENIGFQYTFHNLQAALSDLLD